MQATSKIPADCLPHVLECSTIVTTLKGKMEENDKTHSEITTNLTGIWAEIKEMRKDMRQMIDTSRLETEAKLKEIEQNIKSMQNRPPLWASIGYPTIITFLAGVIGWLLK